MKRYLLDTNHVSPLVTLKHPLRERVIAQLYIGQEFAITTPTITEMLFGIGVLPRSVQNLLHWQQLETKFI